jgi:hypothetical protein
MYVLLAIRLDELVLYFSAPATIREYFWGIAGLHEYRATAMRVVS